MHKLILICTLTFFATISAHASLLQATFTGQLFQVGSDINTGPLAIGDSYTYTFVYDSASTALSQYSSGATYPVISGMLTIDTTSGPWVLTNNNPDYQIQDFSSGQRITFSSFSVATPGTINGRLATLAGITMWSDNSPKPISSLAMPTVALDRNDWSTNPSSSQLFMSFGGGLGSEQVRGSVLTAEVTPVPEPAYFGLGAGVLALVFALRRRHKVRKF